MFAVTAGVLRFFRVARGTIRNGPGAGPRAFSSANDSVKTNFGNEGLLRDRRPKRKISAKEFVSDVRSGMNEAELKQRTNCRMMVSKKCSVDWAAAGLLTDDELPGAPRERPLAAHGYPAGNRLFVAMPFWRRSPKRKRLKSARSAVSLSKKFLAQRELSSGAHSDCCRS